MIRSSKNFGEYSDCLRLTFENGELKEYNY